MSTVNSYENQSLGAAGMMLVGLGALDIVKGTARGCLMKTSTALGSAAMITSFYKTHQFKREDGRYNYANIAMLAFISLSLAAFNVIYFIGPYVPPPDFCLANADNPSCQKFGKATGEV